MPHDLVLPWNPSTTKQAHKQWQKLHLRHQQQHRRQHHRDFLTYAKFGVGIAAGISVVGWIKRKIKQLPVVGLLVTPFLSLMPTVLLGTAVGAAVVYTIDEGDPAAVQKKVLPKVKQQLQAAHRDVAAVAADLQQGMHRSVRELQGQSHEALRDLTSTLDAAAAEAEVTLAPVARRHAAQAQRQLQQLERELAAAAAEAEKGQRRQLQQQQQRPRSNKLLLEGSSEADD